MSKRLTKEKRDDILARATVLKIDLQNWSVVAQNGGIPNLKNSPSPNSTRINWLFTKMERVLEDLSKRGSVLVAMSGGVDSSVIASLAEIALGNNAVAVTANSKTLPSGELEEAKRIAKQIGIRYLTIKVDETSNPQFVRNPSNRCYHCKRELILELKKAARRNNLKAIVDGTNADDLKSHRPGALALAECGVASPLAKAGLTKAEVRTLAKMLSLPTADKPSMACLASRFPYGQRITMKGLHRVDEAEKFIRRVTGIRELRVRDHGKLARIEVGKTERSKLFDERLMESIAKKLKALGFLYVTMDLLGYRSGSMDEILTKKIIPTALRKKLKKD